MTSSELCLQNIFSAARNCDLETSIETLSIITCCHSSVRVPGISTYKEKYDLCTLPSNQLMLCFSGFSLFNSVKGRYFSIQLYSTRCESTFVILFMASNQPEVILLCLSNL